MIPPDVPSSPPPDDAAITRPVPVGGPDPAHVGLATWLARLTADGAARDRARAHWLREQAAEEGSFRGVLTDLADRGRPVLVHLHNGRLHRGLVSLVGHDFVALANDRRAALLATRAIAAVRTLPGEPVALGDRPLHTGTSLMETLAALRDERARVMVVGVDATRPLSGELRAVGRDVLTLRLDGDGATAYVALDSVAEVSLAESG